MNQILTMLSEMNITDPMEIRKVAELIVYIFHNADFYLQAEEITSMDNDQIKQAVQQIQGGQ
jgi:hypothetical protein